VFTGFQAQGTLGRAIVDHREYVRIHGTPFKVAARVFKRHLLTGRTKKRKRQLRLAGYVPPAHHHQIDVLLPYA